MSELDKHQPDVKPFEFWNVLKMANPKYAEQDNHGNFK
jgi:hypothetical protein